VEEALIDRIGHHMHQLSVGLSALDQIQSISESAVRSASKGKAVSTAAAAPSALPAASPLVDDEQELDDGENHPQSNQPAGGIGGF